MSEAAAPPDARPPSPRQVLLGLFILFQLVFLLLGNLLGFVKSVPASAPDKPASLMQRVAPQLADGRGHGLPWIESNLNWWTQLTGQDQDWALFAPAVGKMTAFPCVLLLWDDAAPDQTGINGVLLSRDAKNGYHLKLDEPAAGVRLLLSENEPADVNAYFRVGKCRLRRYEGQLYVNPQPRADETPAQSASRMSERVQYLRDHYHGLALTYMRWRVEAWRHDHAGEDPPKQVILCERSYRIHDPEEPPGWDGPLLMPLLRWLPAMEQADGFRSLEVFDFTEQRFIGNPNGPAIPR